MIIFPDILFAYSLIFNNHIIRNVYIIIAYQNTILAHIEAYLSFVHIVTVGTLLSQ